MHIEKGENEVAISLFRHNEEAYQLCVKMLADKGKACVIHPTGTGKSFIGFKLCEDNPEKTICWLSPSEYIYNTQLENLTDITNGWLPDNIKYFTFARLMTLTEDEIKEIKPDYFVIDEYHRLGAEYWGLYFTRLRNYYPDVPMLGLSATNIRYLDNQRDMANELFDGNIASEMSLGEAIVRGILNPPKYVLSIYSFMSDIEKYEERIKHTKNKAAKEEAEKYLEALRRSLEKADRIEDIFDKNMEDRTGKYIVFCANYEHMQDIIEHSIKKWLSKVSNDFKIYTFYSGDAESDKSFKEFKKDNDNTRLRLLFCIDALNEGVHLDNVSGVILLRPTISPIIYKQQIGRALSAAKLGTPVIFDIVNNIENLYSIDGIKEEMQIAVNHFSKSGENNMIINERFEIIDKIAECRELFRKLESSLSEGWDLMFEKARTYYLKNGNLEVPKNLPEYEGLYSWLGIQRRVYNGKIRGNLTQSQITKLNSIGMRWISKDEAYWKQCIDACKKYKEEHGNLLVPSRLTYEGINLGSFISNMRSYKKNKNNNKTDEHIKELDELGMIWDVSEYQFNLYYECAVRYYDKYGKVDCSGTFTDDETGLKLGSWCGRIRKGSTKITSEQREKLDSINFIWDNTYDIRWQEYFEEVKNYCKENGNSDIPVEYISNDLFIGKWIRHQNEKYKQGKMKKERIELLKSVGISFENQDSWEEKYKLLENYYKEHGDLKIPYKLVVNGVWLNKWLNTQINAGEGKTKNKLTEEQKNKLKSLGISFDGKRHADMKWDEKIQLCKKFYEENGHLNIPKGYNDSLSKWLNRQKVNYRQNSLSEEKIKELEGLGIEWETDEEKAFSKGFEHAEEYFKTHGNLDVSSKYVCSDGYRLGNFISNLRMKYKAGKLDKEQTEKFEKLKIVWNISERNWNVSFEKAREYFNTHGFVPQKSSSKYSVEEHKIYEWVRSQYRSSKNMSKEKADKLYSIGIDIVHGGASPHEVYG